MRKLILILTLIIAIYLTIQVRETRQTLGKMYEDYKRTEWVKAAKQANTENNCDTLITTDAFPN